MGHTRVGWKCSAPRAAVGGARSITRAPPGVCPSSPTRPRASGPAIPVPPACFGSSVSQLADLPTYLDICAFDDPRQIEPVLLHTRGSSSLAEHSHPGSADRHRSKKKHGRPHGVLIVAKRARPAPPPLLATQATARRSAGTSAEKVQSAARPRSQFKMRSVPVLSAMGFGSGPRTCPLA